MKNMETYSKCIVAFLDILGFKNMINTKAFEEIEYSCAITPQVRQAGNRLSGLTETAYASLLA